MRGVYHRICFSVENFVQILIRDVIGHDDIDGGVRGAIVSEVVISTVVEGDK